MAKPPRSPLLGYNHNVKYGGHIFHVQTEDSGPGNPHIFTHLFFEGSILASKRGQYDAGLPEDEVRTMMQVQHKAILKELKQASYDERIARFFEMRGETFRADEFFTGKVDAPEVVPTPEPVAMAPTAAEAPAEVEVLDLDALPVAPTERAATPEPLPIHVTKPAVPGPGTYTFRRPTREHFGSDPASPAAPAKPLPAAGVRPAAVRPIIPVVVQRQVIVGAGTQPTASQRKPTTTMPVRRRPVSGGPYVVKQGSHANIAGNLAGNLAGSSSGRPAEPPPHPVASVTEAAQAPRTAEPKRSPTQEGAPSVFVTDQSLDDVILAYLSQGERKR
jgi:hypothetical protein